MKKCMAADLLPATEQKQAEFFDQVYAGFRAASEHTGEIVRDFRLAGTSVRLRFAGDALLPAIVPGLAYPVADAGPEPQCEICLWDSESTGIRLVSPPRPWKDFTERGNIWGFDSCRYRSAYQWGEGSVNVMDREARLAVFWVPTHRHLPAWVMASPLRSILHWWMELNGRQLVHAAAIGYDGRGAIIPGRGGSGKSSTAVACLRAGMDFIADDYLAVTLDPEPRVHRLYTTAKLELSSLNLFPDIAKRCRAVYQTGFDKAVLFLEEQYHKQLKESLELKLALKPWISCVPDTTLGPAQPLEIERALASETLAHLPHAGAATVKFLNRISHEIPRSAIYLGTDRARIPAVIRAALDGSRASDLPCLPSVEQRPYISIIVHFPTDDREELRALAREIDAQEYPRTELIVMASGAACAMKDEVRDLTGNVRFFPFQQAVVNAEAWNRAIRESFSEFLILIEPGDRFLPGAFHSLVDGSERNPHAAWIQGKPASSGDGSESRSPLRGTLIRKTSFRECGLFPADKFFQGREQAMWLGGVHQNGLTGHSTEAVTLRAASPAATRHNHVLVKPELAFLKEELDRRRANDLA